MSRNKRLRKIVAPPGFKGYKPYGCHSRKREKVELNYEEYEAIKLADYDLLNHQEASDLMGVSRATFARIYEAARRKLAKAFVETLEIKTTYGNAYLDECWLYCKKCHARFTLPDSSIARACPMCQCKEIDSINNQ